MGCDENAVMIVCRLADGVVSSSPRNTGIVGVVKSSSSSSWRAERPFHHRVAASSLRGRLPLDVDAQVHVYGRCACPVVE